LDDVKEASLCGAADKVAWDDDPDRGLRLLVIGRTADGRTLKIVLYPDETDDGRFFLATAFRDSA
jgi:acyl-CoA synthetase (NDP forming)